MQKNIAQSNKASGNIICDDIVVRNRFIGKEVITSTSIARKSITSEQLNDVTTAGSFTNADITVGADGRITAAANGSGGGSATIPVINSVVLSNVAPKTTVDIAGSIAANTLYHVVYIVVNGTPSQIFSDQTPSTAAPAFSVPLNTVTFTNYKMTKGDRVFHAFYTTANITAGILVAYIDYVYQNFTFVRPGPVTGPSSIPWNGSNWAYYFTIIADRQIITSAADAIAYVNNPQLTFADGFFTGLTLGSVGVIDDIGCYTTPVDSMGVPVNAFVMKWFIGELENTNYGTANMNITGTNWTVNWGDPDNTTNSNNQFNYNGDGEYYVTLWADKVTNPITQWSPNVNNLFDVLHWGDIGLQKLSIENSYYIPQLTADDIPATTITDMDSFFSSCFKIYPDVSNWDVSNVTIMSNMFADAYLANPDVSNWDVSSVTDMSYMFYNTKSANPDVSNWDVSSVTDMSFMFGFIEGSILTGTGTTNWDTSSVTNMAGMFGYTLLANPNVSNWNVGNVTNISEMFAETSIANPDVSNWNVSNVTNMYYMFGGAAVANPDVSNWNVSSVQYMDAMFQEAAVADPDVSNWNVSNVLSMPSMFYGTPLANPDVSNWNTSSVTTMGQMFRFAASANPDISNWTVSGVGFGGAIGLFDDAPQFTTANYDNALVKFAAQILNSQSWLNVIPPKTAATGLPAYNFLVGTRGWTIVDGGTI